jgi:hypothetical protein
MLSVNWDDPELLARVLVSQDDHYDSGPHDLDRCNSHVVLLRIQHGSCTTPCMLRLEIIEMISMRTEGHCLDTIAPVIGGEARRCGGIQLRNPPTG